MLEASGAMLLNLYLFCFFGVKATESYEKMAICVYEFNWPDLSIDLQKNLILVIKNMQKPIFYDGFGIARLNLETFSNVSFNLINYIDNNNIFLFKKKH